MKKSFVILKIVCLCSMFAIPAQAHFGMIIPSDTMVMQGDKRTIRLVLSFSHPFEGIGMEMAQPKQFSVMVNGKTIDLSGSLEKTTVMGQTGWVSDYAIQRPGIYIFYMEPTPYWEPAEDCYIIHYTKTVVTAFGDDAGWDAEVGLKTEIVPLAKPFGLYAGNTFQGIVKVDGKPIPYAPVEIEYYNSAGQVKAPTDYMIAQSVKADGNGVFTYTAPADGWWGFAALNAADAQIEYQGRKKDVEIGAVLWVYFHPWGK